MNEIEIYGDCPLFCSGSDTERYDIVKTKREMMSFRSAICLFAWTWLIAPACMPLSAYAQVVLEGAVPVGQLAQAPGGTIYGTTSGGGTSVPCAISNNDGCGTIFNLNTDGTANTLHAFGNNEGIYPATLAVGSDGNIYGLTTDVLTPVLFRTTPDGSFSTISSQALQGLAIYEPASLGMSGGYMVAFGSQEGDGPLYPEGIKFNTAGVVKDIKFPKSATGNFNGAGGNSIVTDASGVTYVSGTLGFDRGLMSVSATQKIKVLYRSSTGKYTIGGGTFGGGGGIYVDTDGFIYAPGTDSSRKAYILKFTASGKPDVVAQGGTTWTSFQGLTGGNDGTLYAFGYGPSYGYGALLSISSSGVITVVHIFGSLLATVPCSDGVHSWQYAIEGGNPQGNLMVAADGSIYGTTTVPVTFDPDECPGYVPNIGGAVYQYVPSSGALLVPVQFNGN